MIRSSIKILIVLPSLKFGGIERTTINILKNLNTIQPAILLHENMERYFMDIGCSIYRFEDFGASAPTLSPASLYAYAKAIRKVSDREGSDIVMGIMQFAPIYATFARDFFFMKSKVVVSYRGVVSEYLKLFPLTRWARLLIHFSVRRSSGIIVPSEGVKRDLIEHFGATEFNTRVIHNGIDLDFVRAAAREAVSLNKDCPWVATSARLDFLQKDFPTLLKAFRMVRNSLRAKLLILGEGPQKEDILSLIREMSLDEDVLLLGFQENPFRYIAHADVFVLSSLVEGFGNVIVEAMALGIPVISTDCPSGPGEIIQHGTNGFLVPVGDAERMAGFMLRIISDVALRNGISQAGLKRAGDFTAQKMAQNYESYFIELCCAI